MTFFLIVPSVIIISIIAVHGIANFVGLKIKYVTLFLCAALAFVALFVALELSSNPDKNFFLRLGAVIVPSALIVTALNRFLILREKNNEAEFTEEVRREYSKKVESESPADTKIAVPEPKPSTADKPKSAEKSFELPKLEIAKPEKALKAAQVEKPSTVEKPVAEKKVAKAVQAEHFEEVIKAAKSIKPLSDKKSSKSESVTDFEKVLQSAQIEKSAESVKAEKKLPADDDALTDVDKSLAEVETLVNEIKSKINTPTKVEAPVADEVAEDAADTETLESLLEYAKAEKFQGNITAAIDAYEKALEDYGSDDYAPFIAIDLSAIYREQAAYTKAIKVYEEALTLPAVKKISAVETEFKRKLAYMQTVQAVLLRHSALTTPFSQIPIEYMQEIELEFRENTTTENL